MKTRSFILLMALLYLAQGHAQLDIPKRTIKTSITEATVFLSGAQVLRKGKVNLKTGTTDVVIEDLPVKLDPTSIQVRGDGDFTIMAVMPQRIEAPKVEFVVDEERIKRLNEQRQALQIKLNYTRVKREAFDEEERLLDESKAKLSSYNEGGISIDDLDKAASLYRRRFENLKEKQWQNGRVQYALQQSIDSLATMVNALEKPLPIEQVQEDPSYQVRVTVSAKRAIPSAEFELSYLVPSAGWLPSYDFRIKEVGKPVYLGFRAQVYQGTEEDWRDVKLSLSSGNPSRNSLKPVISPWYLDYISMANRGNLISGKGDATGNYDPNVRRVTGKVFGEDGPLVGASIVIKGTTTGTFTNLDGSYELAIPPEANTLIYQYSGYESKSLLISPVVMNVSLTSASLDEVVVTAYGTAASSGNVIKDRVQLGKTLPLSVNRVARATSQVYEIESPYSIAGDGRPFAVDVMQFELPADYVYASVPKLDANAYLTARVPDWDAFNLMEGDARLFFEDAYLGKTVLQTNTVADTLVLSLGVDDAVVVEREKLRDQSKSQLLGLVRKETRVFEIAVRNTKPQAIRLLIDDQIPVAKDKSINVKMEEAEGASYDEDRGLLTWDISLAAGESRRLRLRYIVKYPAERMLYLE
jgi:hypothetical protein